MAAALLDPNTYRKDGTAALAGESVSWNGNLFGYAVAQAGSDWAEWRIRDVATGKDATDLIPMDQRDKHLLGRG
jgi:prolyl oligopeptidase